jgi:fido (protein-threonine AMPylation protein)
VTGELSGEELLRRTVERHNSRKCPMIHTWIRLPASCPTSVTFVDRLTYYLGEVNAIHPFREGNGRTQRVFFDQLAGDAGFSIKWQCTGASVIYFGRVAA